MKNDLEMSLIGAGPGDHELIALRWANALTEANAILYDALVNPETLKLAPDYIPNEKIMFGTIDTIICIAEEEKIGSASVMVIGDEVKLHPRFPSYHTDWKSLLEINK